MTTNQFVKMMQATLSVVMSQSCSVTIVVITVSFESLCEQIVQICLSPPTICVIERGHN